MSSTPSAMVAPRSRWATDGLRLASASRVADARFDAASSSASPPESMSTMIAATSHSPSNTAEMMDTAASMSAPPRASIAPLITSMVKGMPPMTTIATSGQSAAQLSNPKPNFSTRWIAMAASVANASAPSRDDANPLNACPAVGDPAGAPVAGARVSVLVPMPPLSPKKMAMTRKYGLSAGCHPWLTWAGYAAMTSVGGRDWGHGARRSRQFGGSAPTQPLACAGPTPRPAPAPAPPSAPPAVSNARR